MAYLYLTEPPPRGTPLAKTSQAQQEYVYACGYVCPSVQAPQLGKGKTRLVSHDVSGCIRRVHFRRDHADLSRFHHPLISTTP